MPGILDGIRIVELAGIGPGPFCGMLLADLGAEVISVERPAGDAFEPRPTQIVNRGKRSIIVDMKAPSATDLVLRLVEGSDALIEGMRPGVAERLGLGPGVCFDRNPALTYGRITGWGQTGPMAHAAGHDSNYTSLSGALWFASPAGSPPQAPPTVIGDVGGGALYLAIGILAGILNVRAGGRGQVVDAAMVDGSAHMLNLLLSMVGSTTGNFARGINGFDAAHWAGRSYRCADGFWVNIAPLEPQFYAEFLRRVGLADDGRFSGGQMNPALWDELSVELESLFASRSRAEWCQILEGTDSCFAPVLAPPEAAEHAHIRARNTYSTIDGVLQAAPAPRFSRSHAGALASVPARGIHGACILREIGLGADEIAALAKEGAVRLPACAN